MSIELVMPSNHLIFCCPPLLPPSIFPSIRVFLNESVFCIRWPKYWSFSFSISPSNEYSGLISFRMDWLGLLAVQGTLKSLLQHQKHQFFAAQLSFQYLQCIKSFTLPQSREMAKLNIIIFTASMEFKTQDSYLSNALMEGGSSEISGWNFL